MSDYCGEINGVRVHNNAETIQLPIYNLQGTQRWCRGGIEQSLHHRGGKLF